MISDRDCKTITELISKIKTDECFPCKDCAEILARTAYKIGKKNKEEQKIELIMPKVRYARLTKTDVMSLKKTETHFRKLFEDEYMRGYNDGTKGTVARLMKL